MRRLLLAASVAAACVGLCLSAAAAASNRSADPDDAAVKATDSATTPTVDAGAQKGSGDQNATAPPLPIQCTADAKGVTYSVEKCNDTNKTILKVAVHDSYTALVPAGPPPTRPPVPEPTAASAKETTSKVDFSLPDDDTYYDILEEDYEPWFPEHSPDAQAARKILREETRREFAPFPPRTTTPSTTTTTTRSPVFPFGRGPSYNEWSDFCEDAKKDADEAFQVPGGDGFNPAYEAVLGLGFYRFHATPRTWERARRACEREGAHLAVPNSPKEADALLAIHNRCRSILSSHFNDYQYVGVHDQHGEGDWITVFGDKLNETGYVSWAPHQPDNAHVYGEDCLAMNRWRRYNDVPCSTELPFTCEHL